MLKSGRGWEQRPSINSFGLGFEGLGEAPTLQWGVFGRWNPVPGLDWGGGSMAGPEAHALRWCIRPCQVLVVACTVFSCGTWELVTLPGIEPKPPALRTWSLSCWTTREIPKMVFLTWKEYV